jgi:hypothetical protein
VELSPFRDQRVGLEQEAQQGIGTNARPGRHFWSARMAVLVTDHADPAEQSALRISPRLSWTRMSLDDLPAVQDFWRRDVVRMARRVHGSHWRATMVVGGICQ